MDAILVAIILGIVEGITEFLPISSTGHLILLNNFLSFTGSFANTFSIVIQLGAILSVIAYFRNRLLSFEPETVNIWKKTAVGVLPAIILGATLGNYLQEKLFTPVVVALALIIGGLILIIIESKKRKSHINSIPSLTYQTAFMIGIIQCLAFIPGTSRSAATIIGAMLLGASRQVSTEYSFYLAIPTITAASLYSLWKHGLAMTSNEMLLLAIGFTVSFIIAWIVIAGFMDYISKNDFRPFGYYRIALGLAVLVYFAVVLI